MGAFRRGLQSVQALEVTLYPGYPALCKCKLWVSHEKGQLCQVNFLKGSFSE